MQDIERVLDYIVEKNNCVAAVFNIRDYKTELLTANVTEFVCVPREDILADIRNLLAASQKNSYTVEDIIYRLKNLPIGEEIRSDEMEVINEETGESRFFKGSIRHILFDGEDKFLLVCIDKTDEIARNRQMESMIEVANSANEAKTIFLANMSHDFRTPMNAITNFNLLIAKNSANPQKVRDYTHKIGLACQNLLSLLNDVLDMSKLESGKTKFSHEEFALGILLEEVNSVIAFQAKAKEQDYQIHSDGIQQDMFLGDKQRINEVLVNILGNAVKYTPVGGRIDFTISEEKHTTGEYWDVNFKVKDNGVGMSKKYQETLFEAFTREEKAENSGIQGTGLGMAITKNLVEMMGGTISVESEEGEGSTFEITLRLQSVNQNQGDFWANHGIHRILVIDNDLRDCTKIETALHDTGVQVFFSTSGYKALQLIAVSDQDKRGFDVIILGMQIKSISCFELSDNIKAMDLSSRPIILLLTDDWEEIAEEARESGIYDFIQKPFFMSTFQQIIEDIINRTRMANNIHVNPLEGMRILAAEDNDINADILAELMNMEGALIVRAEDGNAAVEMFEESDPGYYDVILMDIQMPIMNGYEAAMAIRQLDREDSEKIPIIAMTANAFADDVQKALASGMDAHVSKPIDMELLKTTIASVRENKRYTEKI